jgi:RHS repeat-associated protein
MALMAVAASTLFASHPRTDDLSCQVAKLSVPSPSFATFAPSRDKFPTNTLTHSHTNTLLHSASNATAQLTFGYDVMNRLIAATNAICVSPTSSFEFPISYRRDAGGLVTNIVYAAGKAVSRAYDADGNLVNVKDWLGHEWTFTYNGAGQPTGGSSPGSFTHGFSYDGAGRLSGWSVSSIAARTIERDTAGIRTRDTVAVSTMPTPSTNRKAGNTFDAADKLISASVTYSTNAPVSETYGYDLNGSMTNIVSGTNLAFAATYTEFGQISSLTNSRTNELTNFFYDANGNRVITGDKLWITDHADPLKRPLMECSTNGVVLRYYLWGNGRLLGFIDSEGALTIAHSDEQGSVVALTASNGAVLHTAHYGPHGEDWGTTGTNSTPFAWLGGHGVLAGSYFSLSTSHFSLYLTRHRLYSATLKRFLSADPIGLSGGLNLYAYGEGDPLSYIDPLGLCGESEGSVFGAFMYGAGQGLMGFGDAVSGALAGIANFVMNPSQGTMASMNAVAYLDVTIRDMLDSIATAWDAGPRGQGQVIGGVTITAASLAAPFAKAAPLVVAEESGAANAINGIRLNQQLSAQLAFNAAGGLSQEAITGANLIIPAAKLGNPAIPTGFAKFSTGTFNSPSGPFQVHFYMKPTTGEIWTGLDYKSVFNNPIGH